MTNEEVFSRAYDEVRLRGLSPKTVESYLGRLKLFLKYFNDRPIEGMNEIEIREYLLYLLDSGHSAGSVNVCNSALRFIFGAVLGQNLNYQLIHRRREHREFPALMSKKELAHFFSSMDNLRDRAMFETVYQDDQRRQKRERLDATVDEVRNRYGYMSLQRAVIYTDPLLGRINPKDDHTVHPVGYFAG